MFEDFKDEKARAIAICGACLAGAIAISGFMFGIGMVGGESDQAMRQSEMVANVLKQRRWEIDNGVDPSEAIGDEAILELLQSQVEE